jgi:hypothetical protein
MNDHPSGIPPPLASQAALARAAQPANTDIIEQGYWSDVVDDT